MGHYGGIVIIRISDSSKNLLTRLDLWIVALSYIITTLLSDLLKVSVSCTKQTWKVGKNYLTIIWTFKPQKPQNPKTPSNDFQIEILNIKNGRIKIGVICCFLQKWSTWITFSRELRGSQSSFRRTHASKAPIFCRGAV